MSLDQGRRDGKASQQFLPGNGQVGFSGLSRCPQRDKHTFAATYEAKDSDRTRINRCHAVTQTEGLLDSCVYLPGEKKKGKTEGGKNRCSGENIYLNKKQQ